MNGSAYASKFGKIMFGVLLVFPAFMVYWGLVGPYSWSWTPSDYKPTWADYAYTATMISIAGYFWFGSYKTMRQNGYKFWRWSANPERSS